MAVDRKRFHEYPLRENKMGSPTGPRSGWIWMGLRGVSQYAAIHRLPGSGAPKVVVTAYPKSGGTWLSQIVSHYLEIPYTRWTLPGRRRAVIQGHYRFVSRANDTIVIWRDGRDVMCSYYYHSFFVSLNREVNRRAVFRKGPAVTDLHDVRRYLPRFIEYCFANGLPDALWSRLRPEKLTWSNFAEVWKGRAGGYAETSYEAMTADPKRELTRVLGRICDGEVDHTRLEASIAEYAFKRASGRKRGTEDTSSFLRKGIVGDWRNKFSRQAREVFDHHAGQTLIDLGYERDRSWVGKPVT